MLRTFIVIIALLSALLTPSSACADSWLPARVKTYFSDDKNVRVTVTPREIADALAYFKDKVEEREPRRTKGGWKRQGKYSAGTENSVW